MGNRSRQNSSPATTEPLLVQLTAADLQELVSRAVSEALADCEPQASAPLLVDRRGLAQALSCSPDMIRRLLREGAPHIRLGDHDRFSIPEVIEWLRTRDTELPQRVPTDPEQPFSAAKGPVQALSAQQFQHGPKNPMISRGGS